MLEFSSWDVGGSEAAAVGVLSKAGGGMLLLLSPSALVALLQGVVLSLGGSEGVVALSEAEEGGLDVGGGANWGSEEDSAGISSGQRKMCRDIKRRSL